MSRVDFEELKQISAEIIAIRNNFEQDGRQMSKKEKDMLDHLVAKKEDLLDDTIFHGYGS